MITFLKNSHDKIFKSIEYITEGWFLGLFARFVFASTLLIYFLNSAQLKVGSGFPGALLPTANAYVQILSEKVFEGYSYNINNAPLFPDTLIVYAGTYAEFILPVLVVIGLFTRLASLGMLGFIAVMTFVDIFLHNADATAIGHLFDRVQDSAIADQRLLWCLPLIYLVLKGPGFFSIDTLLGGIFKKA